MLRGAAGLVALSAAVVLGATVAKAAVSFEGKRIQVIVPFSEGGGTDTYSRFLQPFMQKHLPGNPKILVVNKPGAGGIVGTNYFEQRAKRDGTWVMALSTSTLFNYVLGDPRVKFDVKEFIPIILSPRSSMVYAHKDLGLQNVETLKGRMQKLRETPAENIAVGGKTPTSAALQARIAFALLGIEVKSVWGMKGNGPIALAFERGEFQMSTDNSLSFLNNRSKLVEDGTAIPLFTLGVVDPNGTPKRDPVYPDMPNWFEAYEAIHGKKPSGPLYDAWLSLMLLQVEMSKSWNLPAGTPKNVIEAWRTAIQKMLKDPEFIKSQDKIFGPYKQTLGDDAAAIRDAALVISPDARREISKFVKTRYGIVLGK